MVPPLLDARRRHTTRDAVFRADIVHEINEDHAMNRIVLKLGGYQGPQSVHTRAAVRFGEVLERETRRPRRASSSSPT